MKVSSLFNMFGNQQPIMNNGFSNLIGQFQQFKQTFSGDPKQQVQQLLDSGQMYRSSYGREGNGYSRTSNREEVMDYLRDAMDMAEDEKDRKAINRLMTQMSER